MPENVTRLPRVRPVQKPEWADVIDRFYANSFDAPDRAALLDSTDAWASMDPDEQSFHSAHLAFRQLQALADIHATLKRIERGLDPNVLASLKHLPGVHKALVVIARGQRDMVELLEAGREGASPAEDDLEDAIDADFDDVEEEDHGTGDDADPVVPEVLPAGARRPGGEE